MTTPASHPRSSAVGSASSARRSSLSAWTTAEPAVLDPLKTSSLTVCRGTTTFRSCSGHTRGVFSDFHRFRDNLGEAEVTHKTAPFVDHGDIDEVESDHVRQGDVDCVTWTNGRQLAVRSAGGSHCFRVRQTGEPRRGKPPHEPLGSEGNACPGEQVLSREHSHKLLIPIDYEYSANTCMLRKAPEHFEK